MRERKKLSKKAIVAKVFLWISILPYAYIIIHSVISAFVGGGTGFKTSYGVEAFLSTLVVLALYLTVLIPILPVCLIYQVIYIIVKIIIKRKKS